MTKSDNRSPQTPPDGKLPAETQPLSWQHYAWWRENAEALIVAVILALIIRHFTVEAFEIPTGSMADTLYGLHAWIDCSNCPKEFNAALQSDNASGDINVRYSTQWIYEGDCPNPDCTLRLHPLGRSGGELRAKGDEIACQSCKSTFRGEPDGYRRDNVHLSVARCPNCHHVFRAAILQKNLTGGHKILVNKFAYTLAPPGRWDVIVFGFDQWKNYIKRLVGLPGETIQVWDGDVYVDGKIVRKSDHRFAQEALWTQISDSSLPEHGLQKTPAWGPPKEGGLVAAKSTRWDPALLRWSMNAAEGLAAIEYKRRFDNYYNYNILLFGARGFPAIQGGDGFSEQVGDKKVSFTAKIGSSAPRAGSSSWIGAEIRDGEFTFQLRLPIGAPSAANPAVLERVAPTAAGAEPLRVTTAVSIPLGTETAIELENADDRVIARLRGQEILRLDYTSLPAGANLAEPPTSPSQILEAHHVKILADGVLAELSSIRVFRDMFYIPRSEGAWHGIKLGPDEYFAMGDNAPSSSDGRYWGAVPGKNLMGRALLVFWPAWPANFQWKFIR